METRRLLITGQVQGVGFRHHTVQTAQKLGIVGWVRNHRDGAVEAVITGSDEQIAAMIDWARIGPASAEVNGITVEQIDPPIDYAGFAQRETV